MLFIDKSCWKEMGVIKSLTRKIFLAGKLRRDCLFFQHVTETFRSNHQTNHLLAICSASTMLKEKKSFL